jgi:Carboxypeptidase regulatory-like domain
MNATKFYSRLLVILALPSLGVVHSEVTPTDGDWSATQVVLTNTPEAQYMVRIGDIDNLGFGWPAGFDPFSGNSTPTHSFPFAPGADDPDGTDRIMVVTSFNGHPPAGADGYTTSTSRPANSVRPIVLQYALPLQTVSNAVLQIFVDDFQAPVWMAHYTPTINGKPAPFLENIVNSLVQTGPIGRLITAEVSPDFYGDVASGSLALVFDDLTTGAGDGYAIDFVKLLINRAGTLQTGSISGHVMDASTSKAIVNATVSSFDQSVTTDANGAYLLTGVPAGRALVTATAAGYQSSSTTADVIVSKETVGVDFQLSAAPFTLNIYTAVELEFFAASGKNYVLQYSGDFQTWTDDEQISGTGTLVTRLRATRPPAQRFWRAKEL